MESSRAIESFVSSIGAAAAFFYERIAFWRILACRLALLEAFRLVESSNFPPGNGTVSNNNGGEIILERGSDWQPGRKAESSLS